MNYAKLQQTAKRIIEKDGRDCTFSKLGRAPLDVNKPWRGPVATASDPAQPTDPLVYTNVKAVVIPIDLDEQAGNIPRRPRATVLVAEASFPEDHVDVTTLDLLDDGVFQWRILNVSPIMPGDTEIIYTMLVEG